MTESKDTIAAQTLVRKRAEIAGEIEKAEDLLRQLRADLIHIDATLRLFRTDIDPEEIKAIRRRKKFQGFAINEFPGASSTISAFTGAPRPPTWSMPSIAPSAAFRAVRFGRGLVQAASSSKSSSNIRRASRGKRLPGRGCSVDSTAGLVWEGGALRMSFGNLLVC